MRRVTIWFGMAEIDGGYREFYQPGILLPESKAIFQFDEYVHIENVFRSDKRDDVYEIDPGGELEVYDVGDCSFIKNAISIEYIMQRIAALE